MSKIQHWSEAETEAEEAAWWDANSERSFPLLADRTARLSSLVFHSG